MFIKEKGILNEFQVLDFLALQGITAAAVGAGKHSMSNGANLAFEKRETDWDNAFKINVCKIKKDPKSKLIGAEMLYPGFNLGIEDVSSWEWMRSGYSQWVSGPKFESKIDCP
jgi:hypothetical protein